jgi:hypothetical protein
VLDRRTAILLASYLVLLALQGCTRGPTSEAVKGSSEGLPNNIQPTEPVSHEPVVLEPGAVNEDGLIVLRTEIAGTDTPAPSLANGESASKGKPVDANVASDSERNQKLAEDWPTPQAVIFVSGQQHGYLEPCGCTGLENQKGGLIRRDTLLTSLKDRGWELVPVDVGNQVRRLGRQPALKFAATVAAFEKMGYAAATLGIDDLKLSAVELLQVAAAEDTTQCTFVCANVTVLDPSFFPDSKIVLAGGRKIGITAVLGQEFEKDIQSSDIEFSDPIEKLRPVVAKLKSEDCDFIVLLAHASTAESAAIAQAVAGIDLVVTAGGFGEPTLKPERIEGSQAVMVQVGTKGMYGGIVGLFDDAAQPMRYQKIAISSQFKDSERLLADFAEYQKQLETEGFDGLGAKPQSHPSGRKFVGSEVCGDCHTTAFDIWKNSPHHHATESIVNPPNDRGGIQRHFDPECVSCHVTGWNPQEFYPYESGYLSLESSEAMLGSGCENCHGPGSEHVAAENGDIEADNELLAELRQQMILPLARAKDKCMECHDLDNSPDFIASPGDGEGPHGFDEFWEIVKHAGKD